MNMLSPGTKFTEKELPSLLQCIVHAISISRDARDTEKLG